MARSTTTDCGYPLGPVTAELARQLIADARKRARSRRRRMDPAETEAHFGMRCECESCGHRTNVRTSMARGVRLRDFACPKCAGRLRRVAYLDRKRARGELLR